MIFNLIECYKFNHFVEILNWVKTKFLENLYDGWKRKLITCSGVSNDWNVLMEHLIVIWKTYMSSALVVFCCEWRGSDKLGPWIIQPDSPKTHLSLLLWTSFHSLISQELLWSAENDRHILCVELFFIQFPSETIFHVYMPQKRKHLQSIPSLTDGMLVIVTQHQLRLDVLLG